MGDFTSAKENNQKGFRNIKEKSQRKLLLICHHFEKSHKSFEVDGRLQVSQGGL
jgi:hypothetical protein